MSDGTTRLAILAMTRLALPEDVTNPDEYARTSVPAGPARETLQALLDGNPNAVVEVPLTLRITVGDLHRLAATWTGDDRDVVLAAEKAIRKRLDEEGDAYPTETPGLPTGQPELHTNNAQSTLISALGGRGKVHWK